MHYYTCEQINSIPENILEVPYAYTASAKNIYNSGLYIIRQIIAAYDRYQRYDENNTLITSYIIKENLHVHTIKSLELVNQTILNLQLKTINKQTKVNNIGKSNNQSKKSKNKGNKVSENIKLNEAHNTKNNQKKEKLEYSLYEPEIDTHTFYQFLNSNLICNVLKLKDNLNKENNSKEKANYQDYTKVSSHIAQDAVSTVIQDYKNYLSSLKSYYKTPDKFLGLPQQPSYKSKSSRLSYSLDKNRLTKEGFLARVITKDNIQQFTSIKDKSNTNTLFTCAGKKELLNNNFIKLYNKFSFTSVIEKVIQDVQNRDDKSLYTYNINLNNNKDKLTNENNIITSKVEFVSLKFIPNDKYLINGQPKVIVQAVMKHTIDLPEGHLLSNILKINAKFLELSSEEKNNFIKKHFPQHDLIHNISSLDLGVVNHVAMTFNTGVKALLISGKKYTNYVTNKELELSQIKSSLIPQAVKDIQSRHDKDKDNYHLQKEIILTQIKSDLLKNNKIKGLNSNVESNNINDKVNSISEEELKTELNKRLTYPALTKVEKALLQQNTINIYSNKEYIRKLDKLNNYKQNYLHKLSNEIIDLCIYHKINYLVIGKNDGWKQNSNLGKTNNKNSHAIAHNKLINYIQYKALLVGLVVLTTEESYSSKTSFTNNIPLQTYSKNKSKTRANDKLSQNEINQIDKELELNNSTNNNELNINNNNSELKINISFGNSNPENDNNKIIHHKINKSLLLQSTLGGKRKTRGIYVNDKIYDIKNKDKNIFNKSTHNQIIHADINGSFNIMRKIFTSMRYDKVKHCITYQIVAVQSNKKHVQLIC